MLIFILLTHFCTDKIFYSQKITIKLYFISSTNFVALCCLFLNKIIKIKSIIKLFYFFYNFELKISYFVILYAVSNI